MWGQGVIVENIFLIAATESIFALKLCTEIFRRRHVKNRPNTAAFTLEAAIRVVEF